jgi:hypothetical protein
MTIGTHFSRHDGSWRLHLGTSSLRAQNAQHIRQSDSTCMISQLFSIH